MLDRLFGFKIQNYLQALGLFILAFGVPMNKVLMSIGTIWLAANLLLKGDFKEYWVNWKRNSAFWFIFLVLILHFIGLIYTQDFQYSFNDINAKLPLFVIPIALIAYPVEKRFIHLILIGFLLSVVITSLFNFNFMLHKTAEDYRDFSLFGSHIRYALIVVAGILVSIFLWFHYKKWWPIFLILICWFTYYTLISQVLSGYIAFVFLLFALLFYYIQTFHRKTPKLIISTLLLFALIGSANYAYHYFQPPQDIEVFKNLPERSELGEAYYNDTTNLWFENSHHILSLIAGEELKTAWNERSAIDYDDKLENGYLVNQILIRYMTSKGLTKDKKGMEAMTEQDIKNVENGIPTILDTYNPLKRNFSILKNEIYQYAAGGDPDGNSLLQRFEHWKAASSIIKQNWIWGVGTGDVQKAFDKEYEQSNSRLASKNRNRAHNQFMTFWIAFGIFGFILFTGFWIYYPVKNLLNLHLIGIGFSFIAIASFLSEDTIETQQGVTFIALFIGITELIAFYRKKGGSQKS